jgi:hypothetical protein
LHYLHGALWNWYRNGRKPRTYRPRARAGAQIGLDTREFLKSLVS